MLTVPLTIWGLLALIGLVSRGILSTLMLGRAAGGFAAEQLKDISVSLSSLSRSAATWETE